MRHLAIRLASISALALTGAAVPPPASPATAAPLASPAARDFGANLERFDYPWPVQTMTVDIIGEPARMAFMDIAADRPNGRTVVLLHGKNFCGATWEGSARTLINAGFRVIIPDQIGFCKSSKPRSAQYSLELMAALTNKLLITRGVGRASIVGHSMGGMLAMRYAIMFPAAVDKLVLVNPIGLKDRSEEGVGYTDVDTLWATEKRTNYASIKAYQQNNYYHDTWKPSYDRWVWMLAGMYTGSGRDAVALAQAKTSEMIRTQPVAHELERIVTPTTMIIGTLDRTAFGRQQAPPSLQKFLTAIPVNAPAAVRRMRNAVLVKLDGLGHAPQIEAPARFDAAMMDALRPARR